MLLPLRLNLQAKSHVYEKFTDADAELKNLIKKEDEEIITIIMAFMEMENCRF